MSALRELYQQMIIDHGRHPRNFGELAGANYHQEGFNPLCGDKIILQVQEHNGILINIGFQGAGCAISMASASLLTEVIKGKSWAQAAEIYQEFHLLIMEGIVGPQMGKLTVLSGVREFPSRVKCAVLAWHTLKSLWAPESQIISTE